MIRYNFAYYFTAGRSAMSMAGPGYLNEEASRAYREISEEEQEQLRHESSVTERRLTKREVIKRGEKISAKIQHLVSFCVFHCDI